MVDLGEGQGGVGDGVKQGCGEDEKFTVVGVYGRGCHHRVFDDPYSGGRSGRNGAWGLNTDDPAQTKDRAGCVVLSEQFRFDTAITELSNHVSYRGVLSCAGNPDGEVVVVTVDGLPTSLRQIHRASAHAGWCWRTSSGGSAPARSVPPPWSNAVSLARSPVETGRGSAPTLLRSVGTDSPLPRTLVSAETASSPSNFGHSAEILYSRVQKTCSLAV